MYVCMYIYKSLLLYNQVNSQSDNTLGILRQIDNNT